MQSKSTVLDKHGTSQPFSHVAARVTAVGTPDRPVRIGIDARPMRWPGIGRYVSELIGQLAEIDRIDRFFVYCDSDSTAARFRGRWPHVQVRMLSSGLYSLGEQVQLPLRILRDRLDLFHSPSSLVVPMVCFCPLVVTLHDLLLHNHPEHLPSRLARIYFSLMNAVALRTSRQLLTVSDFTRTKLIAAYPEYEGKTQTTHNAIGPAFCPALDERHMARLRRELGLRDGYFLYVGTYKKHKNLPFLVEAYAALPPKLRASCKLLLLAPHDPRYPEVDALVEHHGLRQDVVQVDRVGEDDLIALYRGAKAVVAPSIYEGFGFPVLEGMACRTAVIATRIPAFVEVAGDCAIYCESGDVPGMTAALTRVLKEPDLRERAAAAGLERSAQFTWRDTAVKTLEAYRAAMVNQKPVRPCKREG